MQAAYLHVHSDTYRACSSGPVPMLSVVDVFALFTCANRWRQMAVATMYLPIWHADVRAYVRESTRYNAAGTGLRHVFPALLLPDVL